MIRECDLKDISDGRLYDLNDMVKADCQDCKGCHKCCTGMGSSIVLDPFDTVRLEKELKKPFQDMIGDRLELNIVDGIILPNLLMNSNNQCSFLDENGRCSIHVSRPGICRLFPLGRFYDGEGYKYFLQTKECVNKTRTKVKVSKWIDQANIKRYQEYISCWHYFIKAAGDKSLHSENKEKARDIMMFILNEFFIKAYDEEIDFFDEIEKRIDNAKRLLQIDN